VETKVPIRILNPDKKGDDNESRTTFKDISLLVSDGTSSPVRADGISSGHDIVFANVDTTVQYNGGDLDKLRTEYFAFVVKRDQLERGELRLKCGKAPVLPLTSVLKRQPRETGGHPQ